jgi:hypothetical protein
MAMGARLSSQKANSVQPQVTENKRHVAAEAKALGAPGMVFEIARTFQNLSKPFIFLYPVLQVREKVPPGDPKESGHPLVNRVRVNRVREQHH